MGSDPDDREPEEIRVEIAQTRTEMSGTIDAIQQRLAPDVLSAQAKDIARDATDQAKTAAQEVLQDAVREVKDAAKEVTAHAVHEVRDAARDVTTGAKDAAWDATVGRAEEAVTNAGETAKGVSSIVIDTIKQNPIPAALAGLSIFGCTRIERVAWRHPPLDRRRERTAHRARTRARPRPRRTRSGPAMRLRRSATR